MDGRVDARKIEQYWERAGKNAASSSTMAHEQGLPVACIEHRLRLERAALRSILVRASLEQATVLDLGCGGGEWTAYFAGTAKRVIGVERSSSMVAAAQARTRELPNVEIVRADASEYIPSEPLHLAFLGGLLMYLEQASVARVLQNISAALEPGGIVVARESTVPRGVVTRNDDYQVVYRSIEEYRSIFADVPLTVSEVMENIGYRHMETASEMVDLLASIPGVSHMQLSTVGAFVWRALSLSRTVGMDLLPYASRRVGRPFPRLSNHFFVLRRSAV